MNGDAERIATYDKEEVTVRSSECGLSSAYYLIECDCGEMNECSGSGEGKTQEEFDKELYDEGWRLIDHLGGDTMLCPDCYKKFEKARAEIEEKAVR